MEDIKSFEEFVNETIHVIDPTGFKPSAWQNKRVTRNTDGKEGTITQPIGDVNKGATKYRIVFDDGTDDTLALSTIKKYFEFDR